VDFEMSQVLYPKLNLRSTVFVFFYSVAVAALASLAPARRASRVSPAEALRSL
jgi:putative ABC transport system permease protein